MVKAGYAPVFDVKGVDLSSSSVSHSVKVMSSTQAFKDYINCSYISNMVHSALYRKRAIESLKFVENIIYEDRYFTPALFLQCQNSIAIIDDTPYFYYQNPNSLTRKPITALTIESQLGVGPYVYGVCASRRPDLCRVAIRYWFDDTEYIFWLIVMKKQTSNELKRVYRNRVLTIFKDNKRLFISIIGFKRFFICFLLVAQYAYFHYNPNI